MANLTKIDLSNNDGQYNYTVKIECYFRDKTKRLFEFNTSTPERFTFGEFERYSVESRQHLFSQVDQSELMMTWQKNYVTTPGGDVKPCFEMLPLLHFGKTVESCFI